MAEGQASQARYDTTYSDPRVIPAAHMTLLEHDDRDMIVKMWSGLKAGAFLSAGVSIFAGTKVYEVPYSSWVRRGVKYGTPWLLAGPLYGTTVSVVAKLRNKNDLFNHIAGGAAAGYFLGAWFRIPGLIGFSTFFGGLFAGLAKYEADRGQFGAVAFMAPNQPLNWYRTGWFVKRDYPEGITDD